MDISSWLHLPEGIEPYPFAKASFAVVVIALSILYLPLRETVANLRLSRRRDDEQAPVSHGHQKSVVVVSDKRDSLFFAATDSTLASIAIFALADLRSLARTDVLTEEQAAEVLELPKTEASLHKLFKEHHRLLASARSHDFEDVATPYEKFEKMNLRDVVVNYVGDDNSESECVHAIATDSYYKVITLIFRGSITLNDWVQNAKTVISQIPNPVFQEDNEQPETVGLHLGFRTFLYDPDRSFPLVRLASGTSDDSDKKPCKIEIVLEQLKLLKTKHPDYRILITGHSLGGALSLIASLQIATDPFLSDFPITCVAVGNPRPGNESFCQAIQYLEQTNRLRCICIQNSLDIVPLLPTSFCHPGFRLLLYKNCYELGRSGAAKPDIRGNSTSSEEKSCWDAVLPLPEIAMEMAQSQSNYHNYRVYSERVLARKDELSHINLSDLYNSKNLFY